MIVSESSFKGPKPQALKARSLVSMRHSCVSACLFVWQVCRP